MTTKAEILRAIRQKCLECTCHHPSEIRACQLTECTLWPFRLGRDPEPSRGRGFGKRHGYTEGFADHDAAGLPVAPLPHDSQNASATRGVFERSTPLPPGRS